jgi:hypothetical protein
MKPWIAVLLFVVAPLTSAYGQSSTTSDLCQPAGYVIGYFNGVRTTDMQARINLSVIRDSLFGTTFNNQQLEYELFYNQTGLDRPGVTLLEDFAETFEQRALELDGALDNRWEIFWETLGESSDESSFLERLTTKIGRVGTELKNLLGSLYTDIIAKSVAGWSFLLSQPPTNFDYATHRARVITLVTEKKQLLLFAHSQGNLFVNQAYDAALTVTNANSVKVVHVAPASPTLRGEYALADLDLIINGLRIQGLSTVPPANISLPASHLITDDWSGHGLIETYLNTDSSTLLNVP